MEVAHFSLPLYYLGGLAPHVSLLLRRLLMLEARDVSEDRLEPHAGLSQKHAKDTSSMVSRLCLQGTKLLLLLHSLCPLEQSIVPRPRKHANLVLAHLCPVPKGEGMMGLVVAGLVGQLRESPTSARVLEALSQVGAAHPATFKQAVSGLPPPQAHLLHSAVRSAAVSSAPQSRMSGTKVPQLDFSRYYS